MSSIIRAQLAAFSDSELGQLFCLDIRQLICEWIWKDPDVRYLLSPMTVGCQLHFSDSCDILHCSKQTPELRLLAVEQHYEAVQWLVDPTYEECLAAVVRDRNRFGVLRYVPEQFQTYELCKIAIENNPNDIVFAVRPSLEVCMYAFHCDSHIVWYFASEPCPGFFAAALKQHPYAFRYIQQHLRTEELCRLVLQQDGLQLEFVSRQTPELCDLAVKQNPLAVRFVYDPDGLCAFQANRPGC